jgi:hypothetical protein
MLFATDTFVYRLSIIPPGFHIATAPLKYRLQKIATTSRTYRMRSSDFDVLEGDRVVFGPSGIISLWNGDKQVMVDLTPLREI